MAVPEVTRLIHSLLEDVGEDPARDGLRDTPKVCQAKEFGLVLQ